jgi:hypothetical protein
MVKLLEITHLILIVIERTDFLEEINPQHPRLFEQIIQLVWMKVIYMNMPQREK